MQPVKVITTLAHCNAFGGHPTYRFCEKSQCGVAIALLCDKRFTDSPFVINSPPDIVGSPSIRAKIPITCLCVAVRPASTLAFSFYFRPQVPVLTGSTRLTPSRSRCRHLTETAPIVVLKCKTDLGRLHIPELRCANFRSGHDMLLFVLEATIHLGECSFTRAVTLLAIGNTVF